MKFILEQIKGARIKLAQKEFIKADKQLSAIETYIEKNNSGQPVDYLSNKYPRRGSVMATYSKTEVLQMLEEYASSQLEPPVSQENGGQDIKKITHRLILKIENLPMETDSKLGKEHTGYCKAISDVITVLEDFSRFSG